MQVPVQVPGRMPRAGLLLLPLLLCFGPETARSIDREVLRNIVDHVARFGVTAEYAFAVSLDRIHCETGSNLEAVLSTDKLRIMQQAINQKGGLYDPDDGTIVAARVMKLSKKRNEHAEWRLLSGGQNSTVRKLLDRTDRQNSCLIFFTVNSPCFGTCLWEESGYDIIQPVNDIFSTIATDYKAFVFRQIFRWDRPVTRNELLKAWHQLRNVPLYRCNNNGCRDCSGTEPNTNPCLAEK